MAAGSELSLRERLDNALERARSVRKQAEDASKNLQHKAISAGVAWYYGKREEETRRTGEHMQTFGTLEPSMSWALVLFGAGQFIDGRTGEMLDAASQGAIDVYAYHRGQESGRAAR